MDDDCDGLIDESSTWYADADQDGFGNALDTSLAVEMPTGYVADQTDCNDDTLSGGAAIFPGAPEIFNGIDDDCNGMIDEELVYEDADQDGFGNPAVFAEASDSLPGYVADDSDCNDDPLNGGSAINPAATDLCNLIDDNCNGVTDENATVASISPEGIVSVCTSTDVVFTANTGSGITYQWLKDGAAISGATNNTYTTTKKGDYQVMETNTFNCIATSQPTTNDQRPQVFSVLLCLPSAPSPSTSARFVRATTGCCTSASSSRCSAPPSATSCCRCRCTR